ncbi:oxidoreductase [Adlercreutzia sp. ZJ154]|uniref:oxidoreductase n=1 Tax=Adlercreutzia sp. ZJ154 TaxID=2709790 RepID=UPI0013ED86AE|nr:oxidoreductase [Adlercreutzia sp. ZJ154]
MSNNIGLMFDYEWCTGCQSCEIACRNEHGWSLEKWGIKVLELGPLEMEPGKLEWNYVPFPTSYCDMCESRVAAGGIPTCALHCLANVIEWGPVEELTKKLEEKGGKANIFLP